MAAGTRFSYSDRAQDRARVRSDRHVTGLGDAGVAEWSFRRNESKDRSKLSPEELDRQRRKFDIIDEVEPLPGETFLKKSSPSAFWGTPLVGHLNHLGIDTIITVGESTSGCVRASVVDGTTYRFRMIVVEEGVFDRHEACHAVNLFDMNQKYADVLPLAEVVKYLHSWRAEQPVGTGAPAISNLNSQIANFKSRLQYEI